MKQNNTFKGYFSSLRIFQWKTSEKRTTSLQGTTGLSPMCPLFGGFTVFIHLLETQSMAKHDQGTFLGG